MGVFDSFTNMFQIGNTISRDANTNPDDVVKTKAALAQTGHYEVPSFGITEVPDTGMIDGLKKFQNDNGLKVDGVMKPDGPTATKIDETLTKQPSVINDPLKPKVNKPQPPKIDPLTGMPEVKMPKVKTAIVPEGPTVRQRIQSMMSDKRYADRNDDRLRNHVQQQFKKAFPGTLSYDETGKMVQPVPAIKPEQVEPFDPDGELHFKPSIASVSDGENDVAFTYTASDNDEPVSSTNDDQPDADGVDADDAYRDFDYDKDSHGDLWNAAFNEHGLDADRLANDAHEATREEFGESGGDDESDAFRHAYWSYSMAQKFGEDNAKVIGDGHEANPANSYYGTHNQTDGQTLMDLHNNRVGRELFKEYGNSGLSPRDIIKKALKDGRLQTRPFKTRSRKQAGRIIRYNDHTAILP